MTKQPISMTGLITKGEAKASTPVVSGHLPVEASAAPTPGKPRKKPYYAALTLKVGYEEYMAIKRLCVEREATTQELLTEAVAEWLAKHVSW